MLIHPRIIAMSALVSGSALASQYHVPGDFDSPQAAINAAVHGDVITVGPGIWPGRLDFRGRNLTVQSADGPATTIIDATGLGSGVLFKTGEDAGAILKGFTITGGTGSMHEGEFMGGGVHIVGAGPTILDCVITSNTAWHGGGMSIWQGDPILEDCLFHDNHANGDGGAIRLHHYSYPIIQTCTFTGNTCNVFGGAIAYGNDSDGQHVSCIFDGNTAGLRGGAIASACDCNDPRLWGSSFCNSAPDHILGGWTDHGSNEFCPVCSMDVNVDGVVDVDDVLQIITAFGGCVCVEDVDGDTVVGINDLLMVIAEWGACP